MLVMLKTETMFGMQVRLLHHYRAMNGQPELWDAFTTGPRAMLVARGVRAVDFVEL